MIPPQKASGVARPYPYYTHWACGSAEAVASEASSASCHHVPEYIRVSTVVVPERELRKVQRQVFFAHLVIRAHDAALQERPKRIDVRRMNVAAHVLALAVFHGFVIIIPVQQSITRMFIETGETETETGNRGNRGQIFC